jgi:hypothetical protein
MRFTRSAGPVVLATLLLAAPTAFAHEFQDLRQREPRVDAALSHGSGITGTLSQLSSLASRGARGRLAEQQALASLAKLESQLRQGLAPLDLADRLVVAQTVQIVVLDDFLRLYGASNPPAPPCPAGTSEWGAECHGPVELALDRIAELLELGIRQGFDRNAETDPAAPTAPPAPTGGMDAASFDAWLDEALDDAAGVRGVEQIDD